ncbi:MAG: nucleoside deaminase [Oscillospiraceae bacterium]|nr:nucleoside deaminase [Oscillospiraceae bacterium]
MRELIRDQWDGDSITAAVADAQGVIIAKGKTTVGEDCDPTAHAEINAVRSACKILKTHRLPKGYWLYTTFEPCPLCAAAVIWAGFEGVVYANNPDYRGKEENWSFIKCGEVIKAGNYISEVKLVEDFLIDEIKDYFV